MESLPLPVLIVPLLTMASPVPKAVIVSSPSPVLMLASLALLMPM
jgi:hypothetical protein